MAPWTAIVPILPLGAATIQYHEKLWWRHQVSYRDPFAHMSALLTINLAVFGERASALLTIKYIVGGSNECRSIDNKLILWCAFTFCELNILNYVPLIIYLWLSEIQCRKHINKIWIQLYIQTNYILAGRCYNGTILALIHICSTSGKIPFAAAVYELQYSKVCEMSRITSPLD